MDKPPLGMCLRRGGARLRAMAKAHSPLHVILWQAREAQTALLAAAAAQKMLFDDIAAWAAHENRALSDVCSSASELSALYAAAQAQIAWAYKSLRKDMNLILEGEKRCDTAQKKLQEADEKRQKLRRQVLKAQSKGLETGENPRRSGDFTALQTQLAEAERTADRLHVEACEASREQEAVKLVVVRSAMAKLSDSHLTFSNQARVIFEGNHEITRELPEPPAPGDPLSGLRYNGHDITRTVVERVKSRVNLNTSLFVPPGQPLLTSTPTHSPRQSWTPEPSAPPGADYDPPPPYNTSVFSGSADIGDNRGRRISGGRRPSAGRRPASNTVSPSPAPLNNNISRNAASPRPRNLTNTNPFETESSPGSPTSPTRY